MTNWILRLDEIKVTRDDVVARLPDRIRVSWVWHQVSEVSSKFSRHCFAKAGFGRALEIARTYWESGAFDACEIGNALHQIERAAQELESIERYPRHVVRLGIYLLFCILDPDPRNDVKFGDPICRLPVNPNVTDNPAAFKECVASTTSLVSNLAMTYADLQLWRQGVQFEPSYEEYYDELQAVYFQFSQKCFDDAAKLNESNLIGNPFAARELDWKLHRPLPQIAHGTSLEGPPTHERALGNR